MSKIELPKKGPFITICEKMYEHYVKNICWQKQIKLNEENIQEKLPKVRGVYIIYYKNKPIYIGRSVDIKGRILNHHLCKREVVASSSFRKTLLDKKMIKSYKEARSWILDNCKFKFLEVLLYDDQLLLEAMMIRLWRNKKYDLHNDRKDN